MRMSGTKIVARFVAGLGALAGLAGEAAAQAYPSRPVEIVVPFVPGGGTDLIARATADYLGKGVSVSWWAGVSMPPAVPDAILRKWEGTITEMVKDPGFRAPPIDSGSTSTTSTPRT